jgi:hypothetical protein
VRALAAGELVTSRAYAEQSGQLGDVGVLGPVPGMSAAGGNAGTVGAPLAGADGDLPGLLRDSGDRVPSLARWKRRDPGRRAWSAPGSHARSQPPHRTAGTETPSAPPRHGIAVKEAVP